jgi:hypothetical protein
MIPLLIKLLLAFAPVLFFLIGFVLGTKVK